mmetsp:Transcript_474/g.661  ORF Transcript_474/g.661 Transcript_474/m.661 type:complete len:202 (+) Transcript_474:144-749(+)
MLRALCSVIKSCTKSSHLRRKVQISLQYLCTIKKYMQHTNKRRLKADCHADFTGGLRIFGRFLKREPDCGVFLPVDESFQGNLGPGNFLVPHEPRVLVLELNRHLVLGVEHERVESKLVVVSPTGCFPTIVMVGSCVFVLARLEIDEGILLADQLDRTNTPGFMRSDSHGFVKLCSDKDLAGWFAAFSSQLVPRRSGGCVR